VLKVTSPLFALGGGLAEEGGGLVSQG
jgi:hypothetical protein